MNFRPIVVSLAVALLIVLATPFAVAGQDGTPEAASAACGVEPRSDADVASLVEAASTPVADAAATPETATLPEGDPVDDATRVALETTLREATACAAAGDVNRLLALYSDAYLAGAGLAPEAAPIVPGAPGPDFVTAGTPETLDLSPVVGEARLLADGRVAAAVSTIDPVGTGEIVWFVKSGERWLIDDIRPAAAAEYSPAEQAVVDTLVAGTAAAAGVDPAEVSVDVVESVDWPDTSLGCPQPDNTYAQVITPGYRIVLTANGQQFEYHTDLGGNFVVCD